MTSAPNGKRASAVAVVVGVGGGTVDMPRRGPSVLLVSESRRRTPQTYSAVAPRGAAMPFRRGPAGVNPAPNLAHGQGINYSWPSSALASCRTGVSNPSVNQP
jgi:hypothetical protein